MRSEGERMPGANVRGARFVACACLGLSATAVALSVSDLGVMPSAVVRDRFDAGVVAERSAALLALCEMVRLGRAGAPFVNDGAVAVGTVRHRTRPTLVHLGGFAGVVAVKENAVVVNSAAPVVLASRRVHRALESALRELGDDQRVDTLARKDIELQKELAEMGRPKRSTRGLNLRVASLLGTHFGSPTGAEIGRALPSLTAAVTTRLNGIAHVEPLGPAVTPSGLRLGAAESVRAQIGGYLGQIKACYDRALKKNARLKGRYVIRFTTNEAGHVAGEGLDRDTVNDAEMAGCVRARVRSWHIRAGDDDRGETTVSYAVSFAPDR